MSNHFLTFLERKNLVISNFDYLFVFISKLKNNIVETTNVGLCYPNESNIVLSGFLDSDYVGCKLDRKSTSGKCHLLGSSLISWNSKKQACVPLSIAEVEYIWLKHQYMDYGVKLEKVPLYFDNTSTINLTKNPIQHSKTKHIEIIFKKVILKSSLLKLKTN